MKIVLSAIYDTLCVRQFALQDEYHEGVEAHDDPTRMGMSHFLDDDGAARPAAAMIDLK